LNLTVTFGHIPQL